MEKVTYQSWKNCYRMTNGEMELVAVADIGPRVMRFGRVGGPNLLGDVPGAGEGDWKLYGGHRLWHAPEGLPRSYEPDNDPVEVETAADALRLTQKTEPNTRIQKRIEISLREDDKCATLRHTLWNRGMWPVTLAPWCLTIMQKEGYSICPWPSGEFTSLQPCGPVVMWPVTLAPWCLTIMQKEGYSICPWPSGEFTSLQPCGPVVMWPYTDMQDSRLIVLRGGVVFHQDPKLSRRLKLGFASTDGWAGWTKGGDLFIKRIDPVPDAMYPDFGCAIEMFCNDIIAEVESVAPLTTLDPGESVTHVERWYLFSGVGFDGTQEKFEKNVLPCVKGTR